MSFYELNTIVPNFVRKKATLKFIKDHIDPDTTILTDFNPSLWYQSISSKLRVSKGISKLSYTVNQLDLTAIYRIFQPTNKVSTFIPEAHRAFTKIDHIMGHKEDPDK